MTEAWQLVQYERVGLVRDLAALDEDQWSQPSLCEGWSVREVAAHLVANARGTRFGFLADLARARFDFDRQNAMGVARELGETFADTLDGLRAVTHRRTGPPVHVDSRLVEEVVHGEDIRRPLRIVRRYQPEAVERALRYQLRTSVSMGGARQRVDGLRLRATDADIVVGDGPEVRGPALSLLLVASGRTAALTDLDGPGLGRLA